jgi:parallel beta-helix repeat protein
MGFVAVFRIADSKVEKPLRGGSGQGAMMIRVSIRYAVAALLGISSAVAQSSEDRLRTALLAKTGVVTLPAGVIEVSREIVLPSDAHDLDIRGNSTTIKAAATFRGRGLMVLQAGKNIKIENVSLDGNREAVGRPMGLPPSSAMFSRFTPNNGILAEGVTGLEIAQVKATAIAGFAILVNAGHEVRIHDVQITASGGLNARKRNNATGGILLEEGTTDFEVLQCRIADVRGNGIWTHSLYTSPRNARGRIAGNEFAMMGRDAIQVGHAMAVRVENNRGRMIGYPVEEVDLEGQAFPVAVDTAGNVDASVYRNNQFEEIDGKCFDLDGFHDGEVSGNTCASEDEIKSYPYGNFGIIMNNTNPDMQSRNVRITNNTIDGGLFGGIFIIGTGNTVTGNHLLHLNKAHCNEPGPINCAYAPAQPDLLRSGIYLGAGAERPDVARGNTIENNEVSGYGMSRHCIGVAPGVSLAANKVSKNECSDDAAVALARFGKRH